jgi:glyoxylase-like metal-dependent hydrolase (beta-lactamase superfamily II)
MIAALTVAFAQQAPQTAPKGQAKQDSAKGGAKGAPKKGGGRPVEPILAVKDGLFYVPGAGANSVVRLTNDGLILVDGKLPGQENFDALMAQIRTKSDAPVRYVILTHHHADHTGTNAQFLALRAELIAHDELRRNLQSYEFDPRPAPPSFTYSTDRYVVRLGGVEAEVRHFGGAHTSGDSVVYFPDLKAVAVSDAVTNGISPLIDYAGGGSIAGFRQVLDGILALDFDTAIPGNGGVMTKADVASFRNKFETVIARARTLVLSGVPAEQLIEKIQTDDIGLGIRIPLPERFYRELAEME